MFWSFLWRAVLYAAAWAYIFTLATGFVMGLGGASHEAMRSVGQVTQLLGIAFGCLGAYSGAKTAQERAAR